MHGYLLDNCNIWLLLGSVCDECLSSYKRTIIAKCTSINVLYHSGDFRHILQMCAYGLTSQNNESMRATSLIKRQGYEGYLIDRQKIGLVKHRQLVKQ